MAAPLPAPPPRVARPGRGRRAASVGARARPGQTPLGRLPPVCLNASRNMTVETAPGRAAAAAVSAPAAVPLEASPELGAFVHEAPCLPTAAKKAAAEEAAAEKAAPDEAAAKKAAAKRAAMAAADLAAADRAAAKNAAEKAAAEEVADTMGAMLWSTRSWTYMLFGARRCQSPPAFGSWPLTTPRTRPRPRQESS